MVGTKLFVASLLLASSVCQEQYTPDRADWSTFYSKAAASNTDHSPDGIPWLDSSNWEEWDGVTVYDPTQYTKSEFAKIICPSGDKVRGIRTLFYDNNPFADIKNPTKAEVDNWHALALNHVRAMVGYTAPEYTIVPDKCLHIRALWSDERHRSRLWDTAKYPGTCLGDTNPHCGAGFIPNSEDQTPYLPAGITSCGARAGSEGIFSAAKSNIPWSIKWSRPFCSTLGAEGFWGGHTGPWFHRSQFGWDWWDGDPANAGSVAILRAKWSGSKGSSLYVNPDITSGRFLVNGEEPRFPGYECKQRVWKTGNFPNATSCYAMMLADPTCGKRFVTYNSGGCACYPPEMATCEPQAVSGRITFDFEPQETIFNGYFLKDAPDWNGKRCQNILWKTAAGDALHCLEKIMMANYPECGKKWITWNGVNGGCACYPASQTECAPLVSESGRQTFILQVDPAFDPNAVVTAGPTESPPTPPPTLPPTLPPPTGVPSSTPTTNPTGNPTATPTLQPTALPDQCLNIDCGANGACVEGACKCVPDYYGDVCQTYDPCERIVCVNGGTCDAQSGTCMCDTAKFSGDFCEVAVPAPETCNDNLMNQNETDVDCGGVCLDCPTCTDTLQNQDETGVDCGGACPPCPTCFDGIKNQDEEDVDCGGVRCASCTAPPTCTDDTKNGDETGKDCGGAACPACVTYAWRATNWTECSVACGVGTQTRTISCVVQGGGMTGATVNSSNCIEQGLHPDDEVQVCSLEPCPTYTWLPGEWSGCSVPCGGGIQTRPFTCLSSAGGTVSPPGDFCPINMPADAQICNTIACVPDVKFWVSSLWTDCSAFCGGGKRTRTLRCQDSTAKDYNISECDANEMPAAEEDCNVQACAQPGWTYCAWERCTAMCSGGADGGAMGGTMSGMQTRRALCQDEPTGQALDPSKCAGLAKESVLSIGCNSQACTDYNWMTSLWGPCDRGFRQRTVHCHAPDGANELFNYCQDFIPELKPVLNESCSVTMCPARNTTQPDTTTPPSDITSTATMPAITSLALLASMAALY